MSLVLMSHTPKFGCPHTELRLLHRTHFIPFALPRTAPGIITTALHHFLLCRPHTLARRRRPRCLRHEYLDLRYVSLVAKLRLARDLRKVRRAARLRGRHDHTSLTAICSDGIEDRVHNWAAATRLAGS